MSDPSDLVDKLPFKKNATPAQIISLFLAAFLLVAAGWKASSAAKAYFDASHNELVSLLSEHAVKVKEVSARVDDNSRSIEALKKYGWSTGDQLRWAGQLDRLNRVTVPALVVPEVPAK